MEKIESSGVPEDRDVSKTSKEEFSSAVNRQKGRVSRKLVEKNLYVSKAVSYTHLTLPTKA